MRAHSLVSSYMLKGSHALLYLSTPSRLHSSIKQCILLLDRCFLLLLLSDRPRLSLLLVVLFRMSFSIKQNTMIAHILVRSFVCTKTRILRHVPQLSVVHSFLVLISAAVLLLPFAAVAALLYDVRLFFFSVRFFRACLCCFCSI